MGISPIPLRQPGESLVTSGPNSDVVVTASNLVSPVPESPPSNLETPATPPPGDIGLSNSVAASTGQLQVNNGTLYTPREDQKLAIKNVCKGFETHDRGKLILPCGVGKTLTSLWIKETMKPRITLHLSPSISLLDQSRRNWLEQRRTPFESICVCSDQSVTKDKDKLSEKDLVERAALKDLKENDSTVTTDSEEIAEQLQKTLQGPQKDLVIFSTYHSLGKIQEALASTGCEIDLAICDEAHNTATTKDTRFALIHDQTKIPCKKRLYMTATEKVVSDFRLRKQRPEEASLLCDMDDPKTFGPTFHKMSFKEAIEKRIISDYKILAVGISKEELAKEELDANDPRLKNYILQKAMKETGARHALTFHSTVERETGARAFAEKHREIFQDQGINVFHINGTMPAKDRQRILHTDFINSDTAVLTNAKCMGEGVDAKGIDMVAFLARKQRITDIVQAASRALRNDPNNPNKIGYIVVPIIYSEKDGLQKSIDKSSHRVLVNTIAALAEYDERLVEELKIKAPKNNDEDEFEGEGESKKEGDIPSEYINSHLGVIGSNETLSALIKSRVIRDSRKVTIDLIYSSFTEAANDILKKIPTRPNFNKIKLRNHTGLTLEKLQKLYKKQFPGQEASTKNILDAIYGIQEDPKFPEYGNFRHLAKVVRGQFPTNPLLSKPGEQSTELFIKQFINKELSTISNLENIEALFRKEIRNVNPSILEMFNALWSIDIADHPCSYTTIDAVVSAIRGLQGNSDFLESSKKFFAINSPLRTKLHLTPDHLRRITNNPKASLVELWKIFNPRLVELEGLPKSLDEALIRLRKQFPERPSVENIDARVAELGFTVKDLKKLFLKTSNLDLSTVLDVAYCKNPFTSWKEAAAAVWEASKGIQPRNLEQFFNSRELVKSVGINLYELRKLYQEHSDTAEASLEELSQAIYEDPSVAHFHYSSYLDILQKLYGDTTLTASEMKEIQNNDDFTVRELGISAVRLQSLFHSPDMKSPLNPNLVSSRFISSKAIEESILRSQVLANAAQPKSIEALHDLINPYLSGANKTSQIQYWFDRNRFSVLNLLLTARLVKNKWGEEFLKELLINTIAVSNQFKDLKKVEDRIAYFKKSLNTIHMSPEEFNLVFGFQSIDEMIKETFSIVEKKKPAQDISENILIREAILNKQPEPPDDLIEFFTNDNLLSKIGYTRGEVSFAISGEFKKDDLSVVGMAVRLWGDKFPDGYWFKQFQLLYPKRPVNLETLFGSGSQVQKNPDHKSIFIAAYRHAVLGSQEPNYTIPTASWQRILASKIWPTATS